MNKKKILATLVMLSLMQGSVYAEVFNREKLEYDEEVTAQDSKVQIGGDREYIFHEGGETGGLWIQYNNTDVTINIDKGKDLTIGVGSDDKGLEVSSGANLIVEGGNLKTITNSDEIDDSALIVQGNGSIDVNVENFTAVNGREAAFKLRAQEEYGNVNAEVTVNDSFKIESGGTGIAMESTIFGGNVSANIEAKTIDISTTNNLDDLRLTGIYLLAYQPDSKDLTLTMKASEDFNVRGYKYAFVGFGDLSVDLQGKNLTLEAGDIKSSAGIYLDTKNKAQTHDVKFTATEKLDVSGHFGIMQFDSNLQLQGGETTVYGTTSNGVYMSDSDLLINANKVKVYSKNSYGFEAEDESEINITTADLTVSGGGLTDSFSLTNSDVTLKTALGTINNRIAAKDGSTFKAQALEDSNAYYSIKTHDDDALYSVSDTIGNRY